MLRNALPVIAAASALALSAPSAGAQSIGYVLEPGAAWIGWDDALGIEDGWLYGGGVGLTFGDFIRLEPYYLTGSDLEADPQSIDEDPNPLPGATPFEMDVRQVGANLELALARGTTTPFVRLGAGVLRFDPQIDDREEIDRLTLRYGGGVRFGLSGFAVEAWAERQELRLDRGLLYTGTAIESAEEEPTWQNLAAGANLQIPFGRRPQADPSTGLIGATAPIEVFAAQLQFDDAFDRPDQNFAGVRLGFDVNRLAGLRGFYAWGVNDDFDATQDVRAYGGEARFNLGGGTGLSPFIVAGAARLDYEDSDVQENAAILGGGIALRLSDRLDLTLAARDWLMNASGDLDAVNDPDELTDNWFYSGGLSFRLGGESAEARAREEREQYAEEIERERREMAEVRREIEEERMRGAAGGDSMVVRGERRIVRVVRDGEVVTDTVRVVAMDARPLQRRAPAARDDVIVLPLLEEGEIYIRFGPGGTLMQRGPADATRAEPLMQREELRDMLREEMRTTGGSMTQEDLERLEERLLDRLERMEQLERDRSRRAPVAPVAPGLSPEVLERLEDLEQRMMRRIDALVEDRVREIRREEGGLPGAARPVPAAAADRPETAFDRFQRWDADGTLPYGGVNFGGDTQLVIGANFDFGPLEPGSPLSFVPEVAVGFGEGDPSLLLLGNVRYGLGSARGARSFQPYLTAGAGIFSPTVLAVQTGVGVSLDLRAGRDAPLRGFAELQGLNLFDRTRLLAGVTLRP